ncbi:hypothetical protein FS837_003591 [Tulasnella sp. UAMH 9824]|nr:hypothetical protein FS837_003591 [Tulasnella sp. UAMH 9824]
MQGPINPGVSLFGLAFMITPGAIACGATVAIFNMYQPQNAAGWALTAVGLGLFSPLKADTPTSQWVGFQIIAGLGLGILYAAPTFPKLLENVGCNPRRHDPPNQLKIKRSKAFLDMFPTEGVEITYAAILKYQAYRSLWGRK